MVIRESVVGIVTDNEDPEKRGRVKVKLPTVLQGKTHPEWADATFPYAGFKVGWFFVPEVGSAVEIEIASGEDSVDHPEIFYRAVLYSTKDPIPDQFKTNYPKRKGLRTPSGHLLMFDDKKDSLLIEFRHIIGTGFEWDKEGSWLEDIIKDKISKIAENLTVEIGKVMKMTAETSAQINAPLINLGEKPGEPIPLGTTLVAYLASVVASHASHTHTTTLPGVPTSPPLSAFPPALPTLLSTVSNTE